MNERTARRMQFQDTDIGARYLTEKYLKVVWRLFRYYIDEVPSSV